MNGLEESANFLITLSETIGPVGAILLFSGFIIIVVSAQSFIYYLRKKNFSSIVEIVEKEMSKLAIKIEKIEGDITVLLEIIRNVAQAILNINKKMKYTLSNKDTVSVLRLITAGHLLLNIITQSMNYSHELEQRPLEILELNTQFILEAENKWADYITNLNQFRAPVKIGNFVNERFKSSFFNENIMKEEMGLIFTIKDITFNSNIDTRIKCDRIKTIFSNLNQEMVSSLEAELARITNEEKQNGIS